MRTVTVVAAFEHAVDVTLDEVRVELIFEDGEAEAFFRTATGPPLPAQGGEARRATTFGVATAPRACCGESGLDVVSLVWRHSPMAPDLGRPPA